MPAISPVPVSAILLTAFAALATAQSAKPSAKSPSKPPEATVSVAAIVLQRGADPPADAHGGLLARELVRQAFLLAAREERGWPTRDEALREPGTSDARQHDRLWDVRVMPRVGKEVVVEPRRVGEKGTQPAGTLRQPLPAGKVLDYVALATIAEAWSRGEFATLLGERPAAKSGASASDAPLPDAALPDPIERRLRRMDFVPQFLAVRELHARLRKAPSSAALLGGLVRAYANLTTLTELQLDSSQKVYGARALLYAQRLVVKNPRSAPALAHRGYALFANGLHRATLTDLAAARAIANSDKTAGDRAKELPAWVPLVESACRFDLEALAPAVVGEAWRETALSWQASAVDLGMIAPSAFEFPDFDLVMKPALNAVKQLPTSSRSWLAGCYLPTVAGAAEHAPLGSAWYAQLAAASSLPAPVPQTIDTAPLVTAEGGKTTPAEVAVVEHRLRGKLHAALLAVAPADAAEPSTAALAGHVEELSLAEYVNAARSSPFDFDDNRPRSAGEPSPEEVGRDLRKILAHHPLASRLKLAVGKSKNVERVADANGNDLELAALHQMHRLIDESWGFDIDDAEHERLVRYIIRHADDNFRDLVDGLQNDEPSPPPAVWAEKLADVSPHGPLTAVAALRHRWPQAREQAPAWERRFAGQIEVQAALGQQYLADKQFAAARRCLTTYVQLSPDAWGYKALAETYRQQGDLTRWLGTLEEFLQQADETTERRNEIQHLIARHLADVGRYAEAARYAQAAADEGGAADALLAGECFEALRNWPLAERYYRNADESGHGERQNPVEGATAAWYQFCLRSGYGSRHAARAAARHKLDEVPQTAGRTTNIATGVTHLLDGERTEAQRRFQRALAQQSEPYVALHVALLAMESRQTNLRDEALAKGTAKPSDPSVADPPLADLCTLLRRSLAAAKPAALDVRQVQAIVEKTAGPRQGDVWYFAGQYARLIGDTTAARRAFLAAAATRRPALGRTLACIQLRAQGYDPTEIGR